MQKDSDFKEKIKNAKDLKEAQAIAGSAGYEITDEDWLARNAGRFQDLSDRELETSVGGQTCQLDSKWLESHDFTCLEDGCNERDTLRGKNCV